MDAAAWRCKLGCCAEMASMASSTVLVRPSYLLPPCVRGNLCSADVVLGCAGLRRLLRCDVLLRPYCFSSNCQIDVFAHSHCAEKAGSEASRIVVLVCVGNSRSSSSSSILVQQLLPYPETLSSSSSTRIFAVSVAAWLEPSSDTLPYSF